MAAGRSLAQPVIFHGRTFASVLPATAESSQTVVKDVEKDGRLRPHLGIEVNPNHGLYAFFRKKTEENGDVVYETLEPLELPQDNSGMWLFDRFWRLLLNPRLNIIRSFMDGR